MLVVSIELWPLGSRENAKRLATALITNDGTGTAERGNYHYAIRGLKRSSWKRKGRIADFPRQSYGAVELLAEVLKDSAKGR